MFIKLKSLGMCLCVRKGELDMRWRGETAVRASGFVTFSKYYYGGIIGAQEE